MNSTDTLSDFFNGLQCQDNGEALEGVYLGSFVHDYERSTQNYNVAIKGLDHDDVAIIDFNGSLRYDILDISSYKIKSRSRE